MSTLLFLSIVLFLVLSACEVAFRLRGEKPLPRIKYARGVRPLLRKGGECGWTPSPGAHGTPERRLTILPDGTRYAGDPFPEGRPVLFFGCSFTQGEGLSDERTFPFLVQSKMRVSVENHGIGGYGTYQCLLRLKSVMAGRSAHDAPIVVYGMNGFHGARNVAHPGYLWLLAHGSPEGRSAMPSCRLDERGDIRHVPPRTFVAPFPRLVERSAFATVVLRRYYRIGGIGLERLEIPVTKALLEAMHEEVQSAGGRFAVILFRFGRDERREYESFLRARGIDVIDGSHPEELSRSMMLHDRHPNELMQLHWAEGLCRYLESMGLPRREPLPGEIAPSAPARAGVI